jgi:hypothetical protein
MKKRSHQVPPEARKAEKALQIAVADVIQERRRAGEPVVVWRNGKVVRIAASRIPRGKPRRR